MGLEKEEVWHHPSFHSSGKRQHYLHAESREAVEWSLRASVHRSPEQEHLAAHS